MGSGAPNNPTRESRVRFVLLFASVVLVFLAAEAALRLMTEDNYILGTFLLPFLYPDSAAIADAKQAINRSHDRYITFDPELGWIIASSAVNGLYASNSQGVRTATSNVTYAPKPAEGKLRLAVFGDSYAHGDEVAYDGTFERWLEVVSKERLEVLNYGVPGYGTDQAFLRWRREGMNLSPDIVIIEIMSENPCRNVNIFRGMYDGRQELYLNKPRFLLNDSLVLVNSPVMNPREIARELLLGERSPIMKHERWFYQDEWEPHVLDVSRVYQMTRSTISRLERKWEREREFNDPSSEMIRVTVALARRFAVEVHARGAIPIVLLLPLRGHTELWPSADGPLPLATQLRRVGLDVIDTFQSVEDAIAREGKSTIYRRGHFTSRGNQVIAETIYRELQTRFPQLFVMTRARSNG